jgi:hypothetical protein
MMTSKKFFSNLPEYDVTKQQLSQKAMNGLDSIPCMSPGLQKIKFSNETT